MAKKRFRVIFNPMTERYHVEKEIKRTDPMTGMIKKGWERMGLYHEEKSALEFLSILEKWGDRPRTIKEIEIDDPEENEPPAAGGVEAAENPAEVAAQGNW